jgi:Kdo2-lipid IVA lauroyltransferase/acyltransferase
MAKPLAWDASAGPVPTGSVRRPYSHRLALSLVRSLGGLSHRSRWTCARALSSLSLRHNPLLKEVLATNLSLCLPDLSPRSVDDLQRTNTQEMFCALLDRFRLWALPQAQLREQVSLINAQGLHRFVGRQPVVLLCPHFLGLEAAAQRLTLEISAVTLYRPSQSEAFEAMRCEARQRFGHQTLYPVGSNLLPMLRRFRAGAPLFLLPDLDSGANGAVFSPFFGVQAATSPLAAWCALRAGAVLLPVSVKRLHRGYHEVTIHDPLPPLAPDIAQGTHQVNAAIEQLIRATPEHYWWAQPRFATRPPGAKKLYSEAVLAHAREAFGSAA